MAGLTVIEILAVAALLSALAVAAVLITPRFSGCGGRSKVSRLQADLRSLANCIESYYVDHNAYPLEAVGAEGANAINPGHHAYYTPTFRNKQGAADPLSSLTTPIAYCSTLYMDSFAGQEGITFAYTKGKNSPASWIMWSPGPDREYDIDPEVDYDPAVQDHPSPSLIDKTYDPTNGTTSDGDVWRAKQ